MDSREYIRVPMKTARWLVGSVVGFVFVIDRKILGLTVCVKLVDTMFGWCGKNLMGIQFFRSYN